MFSIVLSILCVCAIASCQQGEGEDLGYEFRPIYVYDLASSDFCYPDYATAKNDFVCQENLNQNAPVYVRKDTCEGFIVYTYFLWYGLQKTCFALVDSGHGDDWEDISVFTKDGKVEKVVYHQHSGYYTRLRGTFEQQGERPIVYVGRVSHGSYHAGCDASCTGSDSGLEYNCTGNLDECPGPIFCGYWDDSRNPGLELRDVQPVPLKPGEIVQGIKRPDRQICGLPSCQGIHERIFFTQTEVLGFLAMPIEKLEPQLEELLPTSGCWQNNEEEL